MAKKEKVYGTHLKVSTKRAGHKIGGTVGIFVFLLVLALFMALPIYLAVVMSLKPVQELFVFPPKLYVIDPTLSNYSAMFRLCSDLWVPFSRYVFNSIFVTVSVTVCQVIFSAMAIIQAVSFMIGMFSRCKGDQCDHRRCPFVSEQRHLYHAVYGHGKDGHDRHLLGADPAGRHQRI